MLKYISGMQKFTIYEKGQFTPLRKRAGIWTPRTPVVARLIGHPIMKVNDVATSNRVKVLLVKLYIKRR